MVVGLPQSLCADPERTVDGSFVHDGWQAVLSAAGELRIRLFGDWVLATGVRSSAELARRLSATPHPKKISFDASGLGAWDEVLIEFLTKLEAIAGEQAVEVDCSALPRGVARLVALARAVPERLDARRTVQPSDFLTAVGVASSGFFVGRRRFRRFPGRDYDRDRPTDRRQGAPQTLGSDARDRGVWADALPITALISFLIGLIIAFIGAIQFQRFGAAIYVADLVGIAMVREMGAMMTAILMSGRTGAAYAANLGTMQVSDDLGIGDARHPADGVPCIAADRRSLVDDAAARGLCQRRRHIRRNADRRAEARYFVSELLQ